MADALADDPSDQPVFGDDTVSGARLEGALKDLWQKVEASLEAEHVQQNVRFEDFRFEIDSQFLEFRQIAAGMATPTAQVSFRIGEDHFPSLTARFEAEAARVDELAHKMAVAQATLLQELEKQATRATLVEESLRELCTELAALRDSQAVQNAQLDRLALPVPPRRTASGGGAAAGSGVVPPSLEATSPTASGSTAALEAAVQELRADVASLQVGAEGSVPRLTPTGQASSSFAESPQSFKQVDGLQQRSQSMGSDVPLPEREGLEGLQSDEALALSEALAQTTADLGSSLEELTSVVAAGEQRLQDALEELRRGLEAADAGHRADVMQELEGTRRLLELGIDEERAARAAEVGALRSRVDGMYAQLELVRMAAGKATSASEELRQLRIAMQALREECGRVASRAAEAAMDAVGSRLGCLETVMERLVPTTFRQARDARLPPADGEGSEEVVAAGSEGMAASEQAQELWSEIAKLKAQVKSSSSGSANFGAAAAAVEDVLNNVEKVERDGSLTPTLHTPRPGSPLKERVAAAAALAAALRPHERGPGQSPRMRGVRRSEEGRDQDEGAQQEDLSVSAPSATPGSPPPPSARRLYPGAVTPRGIVSQARVLNPSQSQPPPSPLIVGPYVRAVAAPVAAPAAARPEGRVSASSSTASRGGSAAVPALILPKSAQVTPQPAVQVAPQRGSGPLSGFQATPTWTQPPLTPGRQGAPGPMLHHSYSAQAPQTQVRPQTPLRTVALVQAWPGPALLATSQPGPGTAPQSRSSTPILRRR